MAALDLFLCILHAGENADSIERSTFSDAQCHLALDHHQVLHFCKAARRLLGSGFKIHKCISPSVNQWITFLT